MEPKGYYDPPSEREWTIAEREEFFASQDARVAPGLSGSPVNVAPFRPNPQTHRCGDLIAIDFSSVPHPSPIEWSTGAWNGPLHPLSSDDPFGELARFVRPPGIHITSIVPPEHGWPIAMHCPICKETTFLLSPWAIKPERGDYLRMSDVCASDVFGDTHNIQMALESSFYEILKMSISPKSIIGFDPTEVK